MYRDGLRQEMKLIKQEVEVFAKDKRKETYKRRREEKEIEQAEKVGMGVDFLVLHGDDVVSLCVSGA